jgi:hypothetical protein
MTEPLMVQTPIEVKRNSPKHDAEEKVGDAMARC